MAQEPIRSTDRDKVSAAATIPPPIGGLNCKDSYATMPITDAIEMVNFIPQENSIELRKGYKRVTISGDDGKDISNARINSMLAVQRSNTADMDNNFLVMWVEGEGCYVLRLLHDNSFEALLKRADFNSASTIKFSYIFYNSACLIFGGGDVLSSPYLFIARASDTAYTLIVDNGGTAPIRINYIEGAVVYRNIIFFWESRTHIEEPTRFFYTQADAPVVLNSALSTATISATPFSLIRKTDGIGRICLMLNWAKTGAEGINDYLIAITTTGDLFVFSGTDPAEADKWTMHGKYKIPKLINIEKNLNADLSIQMTNGPFIWERLGGDIVLLTEEGLVSIAALLSPAYIEGTTITISDKINSEIKELYKFDFDFWQLKYINEDGLLILNAPDKNNRKRSTQYVYNVSTDAWCKWKGLNASCFTVLMGRTFFGSVNANNGVSGNDGGLFEMFVSQSDNGQDILGHVQQAYSNFETPKLKTFKIANIIYTADSGARLQTSFVTDFGTAKTKNLQSLDEIATMWNVAEWDVSPWSTDTVTRITPVLLNAYPGYYGSLDLTIETKSSDFKWHATMVVSTLGK